MKRLAEMWIILERRVSDLDRRSGKDRRRAYDLDYFLNRGNERRRVKERRSEFERRKDLLRLDKWCGISVYDLT